MKYPDNKQVEAVLIADPLLTFCARAGFTDSDVIDAVQTKILDWHGRCEPEEQAEKIFMEAALEYLNHCKKKED